MTFLGRRFQVGESDFFFVLALLELKAGNVMFFGKTMDRTDVRFANPAEGGGRRDREISLPAEKTADVAYRLQLGNVAFEQDSIEGANLEGDVITE